MKEGWELKKSRKLLTSLQDKEHHKAIQTIVLTAFHLLRQEIFQN